LPAVALTPETMISLNRWQGRSSLSRPGGPGFQSLK
jgi:hypothetical protein